jgi:TM2 domain-containing membrane protein YozV
MNGDVGVGVTILVLCWLVLPITALITCGIGLVFYPVVWIWALIDAYTGAQRWNARHGFIS